MSGPTTVYLGNRDAYNSVIEVARDAAGEPQVDADGNPVTRETVIPAKGKRRTVVVLPAEWTLRDSFLFVTDPTRGAWAQQTASGRDDTATTKPPAWVASDNPALASLLADHFGGIDVRDALPNGERDEFAPPEA